VSNKLGKIIYYQPLLFKLNFQVFIMLQNNEHERTLKIKVYSVSK